MALEIRFFGTVDEVLADMNAYRGRAPNAQPESPVAEASPEAAEPKKNTRKKAPAADVVIDQAPQPVQTDIEEVTGATPQPANEDAMTISEARERLREVGKQPMGLEAMTKGMAAIGVKKISEVDPDAGDKPSAKIAALVADINRHLAELQAAQVQA